MKKRYFILIIGIGVLLVFTCLPTFTASFLPDNPLDNCNFVYLDMGTNFGVQIRKLYEPHLYPGAPVLKVFDQYFGDFQTRDTNQVCAVGWEPNPKHVDYLQKMTDSYKSCGYRVVINTRVGVGAHSSTTEFVETSDDGDRDWGAHVKDSNVPLDKEKYKVHNITVVRIAEFINTVVGRRKINKMKGVVVMKLDVEGLELEVLADLVHSGALQHLDYIYVDFHEWMDNDHKSFRASIAALNQVIANKKIQLLRSTELGLMDDETYGAAGELKPLPECRAV